VSVIDLESFNVVTTIQPGTGEHGAVVDRDGRHACLSNIYANSVSAIDVEQRKLVATVRVGKERNGIRVTP
jgi:DNA-binding beta-propeller fold protein YncE